MKNQSITITLIISFLFFISCNNSEKKFNKAKATNTIAAFEQFIQQYPESKYTELAKDIIDSLAYEKMKIFDTEGAYYHYYSEYPDSRFAIESRNKAASIAFDNASEENEESVYMEFVKKYSGTKYEKKAMNNAAKIRLMNIYEDYSKSKFQKFVIDYPDSEYVENVKKIISDIHNGRYEALEKTYISYSELIDKFSWDESYSAYICGGGTGTLEYLHDGHLLKGSWCIGNLKLNGTTAFQTNGITLYKGTIMNYPADKSSL